MFCKCYRWSYALALALLAIGVGCQREGDAVAEADSAEPVASFRESIAGIEAMATQICKAFSEGTPDDAHDALHEVGHSLEQLPELAAKEGKLNEEQMTVVNEAVEALFDGFGKLDDTLHGGEEVDIAAIESTLTETLAKLNEVAK